MSNASDNGSVDKTTKAWLMETCAPRRRDPLTTVELENRLRESNDPLERERLGLLLDVDYEHRSFIVQEAAYLALFGFDSVGSLALAIRRWERHGWKGIHSERARVLAARAHYNEKAGLPLR